jgi:hypothetical protein
VIAGLALACTAWPALRGTLQGFISLAVSEGGITSWTESRLCAH